MHLVSAQIGLQLASENLQGSRFSNSIGPDKTQNLACSRGGQTVELEGILRVAMGGVLIQVARKIDDGDGLKRAFLKKKFNEFLAH